METHSFDTQDQFLTWLKRHHTDSPGIWVRFLKKAHKESTGVQSITYREALDVALCYGWIDSLVQTVDASSYKQKFSPRGPKSVWSKINKEHVARLIKEKRMAPAGMVKVNAAKRDGRWAKAYDSPRNMKAPGDFLHELSKNAAARSFYDTLSAANMYAIAWRLHTAKKSETRAKRMQIILNMLQKGQKFH